MDMIISNRKYPLILDGGVATLLMQIPGIKEDKGQSFNPTTLNLTHPERVERMYLEYLKAGADIITTNTFASPNFINSNLNGGHSFQDCDKAGVVLAHRAIERFTQINAERERIKPIVAGSIGPGAMSLTQVFQTNLYPADVKTNLYRHFKEKATLLLEEGCDLLLLETFYDLKNAEVAAEAISAVKTSNHSGIPVCLSFTCDKYGRLFSGETIEDAAIRFVDGSVTSIGLNCGVGLEDMIRNATRLYDSTPLPFTFHPNGNIPEREASCPPDENTWSTRIHTFLKDRNILFAGGCCGTTPLHIRKLRELFQNSQKHLAGS